MFCFLLLLLSMIKILRKHHDYITMVIPY